jgi:hypothetical protein
VLAVVEKRSIFVLPINTDMTQTINTTERYNVTISGLQQKSYEAITGEQVLQLWNKYGVGEIPSDILNGEFHELDNSDLVISVISCN